MYFKWRYKRHYRKHIEEHYKGKIGVPSEIWLEEGFIYSKDHASEGKLSGSEIETVYELSENLFIKLRRGESIIIPTDMQGYGFFKEELAAMVKENKSEWKEALTWHWK